MRLPDLVVVPADVSAPGALDSAPLIAIEVLSPDDSYNDLRQRARDLGAMGTQNVWLIDPSEKTLSVWDGLTWQPFQGDRLQAAGTEAYLETRGFGASLSDEDALSAAGIASGDGAHRDAKKTHR